MNHTPWTKEEAEKWAKEYVSHYDLEMLANGEGTLEEIEDAIRRAVLAGMAKAAEMIEKCETIRYTLRDGKPHTGSYELWEAYLVGVREIEGSEK